MGEEPDDDTASHLDRATVNGLVQLARDLAGTTDLPVMLTLLVDAITEIAGFECAAINLVTDDGDLQVVAVAGPSELEVDLLGAVGSRDAWDAELAHGERHGAVILQLGAIPDTGMPFWVSDDDTWFARTADQARAWRPEHSIYVPMEDNDGELLGVVSVDMPSSGLVPDDAQLATIEVMVRQAETAIIAARALARTELDEHIFASVFDTAAAVMCIADRSGRLTEVNRGFRERFGELERASGIDALISEVEGTGGLQATLAETFTGPVGERSFVMAVGVGGDRRWFHVAVRGVAYAGADPVRAVCAFTDITAERLVRDQYQHDAEHDGLTGLLNRRGLHHAYPDFVAAGTFDEVVVVLFCDLDDFKLANDLLGHQFGDEVLVEVAACMRAAVTVPALMSRMGGDEFVVVARCASRLVAERLAASIVDRVSVPLPDGAGVVTSSVGMALDVPPGRRGLTELMREADEALYRAKRQAKGGWVWSLESRPNV